MNFQIRTASLARSVLCFGYQDCESNFPTEPLGRKKKAYTERVYDFDNEINLTTQVGLIKGKLKVYPNPTNNEVTVELNEFDNNATYLLEVRSLEGKLLINKKLLNNKLVLSTNNIAAGNYLLLLLKNDELSAETILVKQ